MDRQEVIAKLLEKEEACEEAMRRMSQYAAAVPTARWCLEEARTRALAAARKSGITDADELALWFANSSEVRRAHSELLDMECGVETYETEAEIARMNIRVLEIVAKLLEPQP